MCDDTYNGWANRETWAVALHLSNDEWVYRTCRRIVADADTEQREWMAEHDIAEFSGGFAADLLETFVSEAVEEVLFVTPGEEWARLMISDVGSFWRVDWIAVAESFREES